MRPSVSHPARPITYRGIGGVLVLAVTGAVLAGCSGGMEAVASAPAVPAAAAPATAPGTDTPTPATRPVLPQPPVDPPAQAPVPVRQGIDGRPPQPGGASEPATGANGLPDVAAQPAWTVGETRPFRLHVHCGIKTAKIGSELWAVTQRTESPSPGRDDPPSSAPDNPNELAGTMTLVEPFLARFTWDVDGITGTAEFAPPAAPVGLCR
jgi:hypothetical protein